MTIQGSSVRDLRPLCSLTVPDKKSDKSGSDLSQVAWMPGGSSKVMALAENRLCLQDVDKVEDGKATVISEGKWAHLQNWITPLYF